MTSTPTPEPERQWVCHKPGWMGPCSPQSTHHNGFDWGCGWIYFPAPSTPGEPRCQHPVPNGLPSNGPDPCDNVLPCADHTPGEGARQRPASDADQLREAAKWFDVFDKMGRSFFAFLARSTMSDEMRADAEALIPSFNSDKVQQDLRRIADHLDAHPPAPPAPLTRPDTAGMRKIADRYCGTYGRDALNAAADWIDAQPAPLTPTPQPSEEATDA